MTVRLKSYEFRRERQSTWRELERLVGHVEKSGVRSLNAQQLSRLPQLYHATLSSLSVARAISLDRNLLEYLESLCARSYFCVYGTKQRLRDSVTGFFGHRFPAAVRRYAPHAAIAAAVFLAGLVTAWTLTARNSDWFYSFVGPGMASGRDPAASTQYLRSTLYDTDEHAASSLSHFASFLFTHNARVSILCFAVGFVAGLPVYLLMFLNGLMLGAFSALFHARGLGADWWGWILPHGITEIGAIWLAGGAGLALAQALVFPGRNTRLRNLARAGRDAGVIVLGAIAMLGFAAVIEGVFRQTVTSIGVRYAVATVTGLLLLYYFARVGRKPA